MCFHMKLTLNRTDRCNKNTHAQGIHVIYVKSIHGLLKLSNLLCWLLHSNLSTVKYALGKYDKI